jgi:hypothetical protein
MILNQFPYFLFFIQNLGNFSKNVELEKYNPFFVGQPRLFTGYVLDGKKLVNIRYPVCTSRKNIHKK